MGVHKHNMLPFGVDLQMEAMSLQTSESRGVAMLISIPLDLSMDPFWLWEAIPNGIGFTLCLSVLKLKPHALILPLGVFCDWLETEAVCWNMLFHCCKSASGVLGGKSNFCDKLIWNLYYCRILSNLITMIVSSDFICKVPFLRW